MWANTIESLDGMKRNKDFFYVLSIKTRKKQQQKTSFIFFIRLKELHFDAFVLSVVPAVSNQKLLHTKSILVSLSRFEWEAENQKCYNFWLKKKRTPKSVRKYFPFWNHLSFLYFFNERNWLIKWLLKIFTISSKPGVLNPVRATKEESVNLKDTSPNIHFWIGLFTNGFFKYSMWSYSDF
jgi:hypothetical protein